MEVENWRRRCLIPRWPGRRFLNEVRKGVETHASELDEAMGGHLHRLLENRDPNLAASSSWDPWTPRRLLPLIPPLWGPFAILSKVEAANKIFE
jgi:hypothetical protein